MSNDEILVKLRKFVTERVEQTMREVDDGRYLAYNDLLPLYLQFQIFDMLDSIDSRLITLEDAMERRS